MANIFKRIKTIEPMGDVPRDVKTSPKPSNEAIRLGLKPVLKTTSGELANAADFQDPFGHEDETDLSIPEFEAEMTRDETSHPKDEPVVRVGEQQDEIPQETIHDETIHDETIHDETIDPDTIDIASKDLADKIEPEAENAAEQTDLNPIEPPSKRKPISLSVPIIPDKKLHLHPVHKITPLTSNEPEPSKEHSKEPSKTALAAQDVTPMGDEAAATDQLPQFLSAPPPRNIPIPDYDAPKWPFWTLGFIAFLWLLGSAAAAYGYFELGLDKLTAEPIHAFGFIGFVIVPACLLGLTAVLLRYLNRLGAESQKLAHLNRQLLTPSQHTAVSTTRLVDDITHQMDRIEQRADQALSRLMAVQSAFSSQIDDMGQRLKTSAQEQINLDQQLQTSKSAWGGAVKETDQSLTNLSIRLESLFESFQNRVETTQAKLTDLNIVLNTQVDDISHQLTAQSQNVGAQLTPLLAKAEDMRAQLGQQNTDITSLENQLRQSLESLDSLMEQHADKLRQITAQQDAIKSGQDALSATWDDEDNTAQDRLFRHISQIDRLNERTDDLIKKIDEAAARLAKTTNQQQNSPQNLSQKLPLRGTMQEEQLSLLPGLGAAKDMLPSLLTPENQQVTQQVTQQETQQVTQQVTQPEIPPHDKQDDAIFSYRDLDSQRPEQTREMPRPINTDTPDLDIPDSDISKSDIPESLSSHRVFGHPQPVKQNWFKRFGRRATEAVIPQTPIGPVSAPPQQSISPHDDVAVDPSSNLGADLGTDLGTDSGAQLSIQMDTTSLRDKLIAVQLSPDALIGLGAIQQAAHLRVKDGPFAMSRHIATHLGAAIDDLRGQLPDDSSLRRQVYDMAAGFPLRERLDEQDEDSLIAIFESQAGREYLLCDAALNG